jgi:hypothetical protein
LNVCAIVFIISTILLILSRPGGWIEQRFFETGFFYEARAREKKDEETGRSVEG